MILFASVQEMGDKLTARHLAEECGVPTVPGSKEPITDAQSAMKFSKSAGFPVILKAAMGGGGRGMRVVHQGEIIHSDAQSLSGLSLVLCEVTQADRDLAACAGSMPIG